jgi:hypothetical protein
MSWGEIYNTSWWGVALDTARTVKARPDFFGSQLNLLTSEQPNLVTNGTFDTDSDWIKGTGWSISGGTANGSLSFENLVQAGFNFISGKNYKVTYEVKNYVNGNIKFQFTGGATLNGTTRNSNGIYTQYVEATANHTNFRFRGTNFTGSIDNVSVQVARAELDQIEAKKCLADWIHTTALKDLNN